MLNNVLKFLLKILFDKDVRQEITKILTFSNRFFREMYLVTEKLKQIKQKFQNLKKKSIHNFKLL